MFISFFLEKLFFIILGFFNNLQLSATFVLDLSLFVKICMHLKVVLQTNLSVSMRSTITQMEPELLQGGKNKAEIYL